MEQAPRDVLVRFRVLLDGWAQGAAHGIDVDGQGNGVVVEQRLYQPIRQPKPIVAERSIGHRELDSRGVRQRIVESLGG
jgi:hypothetical protein